MPQSKKQQGVSVLLIEDDAVDVMGVQRAFRQSDLSNPIVVASNGMEALEKLRDGKSVLRPYMVLLDLNMPKMNGIEFLQETRSDPDLQSAIIFVLTTSKAQEDKEKAYKHNVAGYIVKDRTKGGFINAADLLHRYSEIVEFP